MMEKYSTGISREMHLTPQQVEATARLLDEGATVPFIARYRKEATGSLDETVIVAIRDRLAQLRVLDKRREAILKSLEEQQKLTDELKAAVDGAETLAALEDIYLPYRPKRRTRATVAREKGLEPLASLLMSQQPGILPQFEAARFIDDEKGVASLEEALAGARDIIAESISDDASARAALRDLFAKRGVIRSRAVAGKEAEGSVYRDYFEWEEPLKEAPSHRVLALFRGEREGFLAVHIDPPEEEAHALLDGLFVKGSSPASGEVGIALRDGYKRLLSPSMETETRAMVKERADAVAIRIFSENLRHLLMAPALGSRKVMAVDPGFRTGCKVVCLDPQGKLLHRETIYPHTGEKQAALAKSRVTALAASFGIEAIAIGNGTAGRETETFVREAGLGGDIQVVSVDESGASVYSASAVAREEFPEEDVTIRGAVSIGRRLMDPLAELVKIDPKSIGVGQYQHDIDQKELKKSLDDTVTSCVNAVGVELNTASAQLMSYVSGLGPQLARNITAYRDANGPFAGRAGLKKVPRLGPKAFEQAAGFLRIRNGTDPLDASAVHPESYPIVESMAKDNGCTVADLMREAGLRERIDLSKYVTEKTGLPTLRDIMQELAKPGRDPRESFDPFSYASGIEKIEDLRTGMRLPGIVTNVTAFGAFVDIGVHRDGLVHVSELSDHFVKDPQEMIRVRQRVTVTVTEVDLDRKRISLSMKTPGGPQVKKSEAPKGAGDAKRPEKRAQAKEKERKAFNNPFAEALKGRRK
ncbi:MAG: Tex family protein [Syntrophobacteraceae bacterium]|nr:RNA-binding transcriptional accessory protein [Desulfobacteraceae bacterium]